MSNRLDKEREARLQPIRMEKCKETLEELGFNVVSNGETRLDFMFNGSKVSLYPYSGWHSGKTIKDGRGFSKLLKQIKN